MALNFITKQIKLHKFIQNIQKHVAVVPQANFYRPIFLNKQSKLMPQVYYGGRHTVTLLPGAGIGPELMGYVKEVFNFSGVPVDFEEIEIDDDPYNDDFDYAITSIRRNGIALKGNIEVPSNCKDEKVISANVLLRKELDLYVNLVHCVAHPGVPSRYSDVNIVMVRQNIEGEYSMMEHQTVKGVVESMKVVSKSNAERIIRYAFEYAKEHNRKKITTIHKANIMKLSDGLFLNTAREIAEEYPSVIHNDMIVDNACMQLIANPYQFDMLLTTNLYGSVICNVLCGLLGGAGLLSGKNIGDRYVIFEPATRNTGMSIAGKNVANPIAMFNASIDMLRHLGLERHATIIRCAIDGTISQGVCTKDLGGHSTSRQVVDCIMEHVEKITTNNIFDD